MDLLYSAVIDKIILKYLLLTNLLFPSQFNKNGLVGCRRRSKGQHLNGPYISSLNYHNYIVYFFINYKATLFAIIVSKNDVYINIYDLLHFVKVKKVRELQNAGYYVTF